MCTYEIVYSLQFPWELIEGGLGGSNKRRLGFSMEKCKCCDEL